MFSVFMFFIWFGVWILLSWPVEMKDIDAGVLASLFVLFLTRGITDHNKDSAGLKKIDAAGILRRAVWFIWYLLVFICECLKANLDVAYRVIHPGLPIRPATVRVKVGLKSDIGLTFLANSITLTPGTTSVDVDKESGFLYVHKLYLRDGEERIPVVDKFEYILSKIFE